MRGYGKVSPRFWNGPTGKAIRALGPEAQVVALYLMTAPSSSMTGLYYLPIPILAHETGCPFEGASKALRSLSRAGFCTYDGDEEVVWVPEMAKHQIGDALKPGDKRVAGVAAALEPYRSSKFYADFIARYGAAYGVESRPISKPLRSPLQAPSEPLRSQEQEQEQEQDQDQEDLSACADRPPDDFWLAEGTDTGKRHRKQPTGDHATFIARFGALFAEVNHGAEPTWGKAPGAMVKGLLSKHPLDECIRRAENMFRAPPDFPGPPYDLKTFIAHFDKFAQPFKRTGGHFKVTGDEVYAGGEVEI